MATDDPVLNLARLRIIRLSAELEAELSSKDFAGPTIEILNRLKERAAESLAGLIVVNLHNPDEIAVAITLQNEVKRYDEWFTCIHNIVNEGKNYDDALKEEEREDLLDVLTQTEEGRQEAVALGMIEDISRE